MRMRRSLRETRELIALRVSTATCWHVSCHNHVGRIPMPNLFPPRLEALIIEVLTQPRAESPRERWVTDKIVAGPNGFISLRPESEGGPKGGQRRLRARNAHLEVHPSEMPNLLSQTEIARELSKYQRDPMFRGDRRVPLRALARIAGIGKMTIYEAARGKRISDRSRLRLSLAIRAINSGELRFRRHGRGVQWERVPDAPTAPIR
jgi:hypothetical protein